MVISSIIMSAWLIKPLIGFIIDNSLNKKIWIVLASLLSVTAVLLLGLNQLSILLLVTLLLLHSTYAAFRDVGVDGIMCVEGKKAQATGKIQSVQWISINVSGILVGIGGGYIAEKSGYKLGFLLLIPVYLIVILIALRYKEEKTIRPKNYLLVDLKKLFRDKNLVVLALFIFLYKYSPSFGTPLFFLQRDSFKWGKIWIGSLSTIGTVFGIVGSLCYYKMSAKINLKKWLYWSVFLGAATTLSYLYYTPVTAVIYDIVYSFIGMFIFLMIMDFMARNTLSGLEATSFAFLCSVSNLALVASNLSGAFFLPKLGLQWLIIISSLTSFLCLPLIKHLQDR